MLSLVRGVLLVKVQLVESQKFSMGGNGNGGGGRAILYGGKGQVRGDCS